MPSLPGTPSASTCKTSATQRHGIVNLAAGYAYSHTSLGCVEPSTLDLSAKDSKYDTDYDPDMLADERTSTG
jgi:hypothetical protein